MNRRQLIKGIGAAICAGMTPSFLPSLMEPSVSVLDPIRPTSGTMIVTATPAITSRTFTEMLEVYYGEALRERLADPDYNTLWGTLGKDFV